MKTFTIENETNNITVHGTKREAAAVANTQSFTTAEELGELAANWPGAQMIEVWNSIPGNTAVAKFKDRATAVARIWKAIQPMIETYELADRASAPVAEAVQVEEAQTAAPAPESEPSQKPPAFQAETPEGLQEDSQPEVPAGEPEANVGAQTHDVAPGEAPATKKATRNKNAPTNEPPAKHTRNGSKTEAILSLMKQPGGTTLKAIMQASNWQPHSVRGFISGTLGKKMGLTVVSSKTDSGERTYKIGA